jgi:hypothetical protein
MPITRRQFDKAMDTMSKEVVEFLKSHPGEAFAVDELAEAVGGRQLEIWATLEDLKRRKIARGKCIKGKSHYCIS